MIRDCQKKKKVCILLTILYSGRYALLVIALLYRTLYISPFVCVCVLWRCQRVWLVSTLKSNNIYATRTIYVSTPGRFFEKRNFFHSSLLPYISRVRRFNPFFFFYVSPCHTLTCLFHVSRYIEDFVGIQVCVWPIIEFSRLILFYIIDRLEFLDV